MFDEKASISDRKNWWEKFTNMYVQGGWTSQVKIRELKMKMPWKNLPAVFRREYLKSHTSEPERYFTMRQKLSESALDFFFRLNEAAVKMGIKYHKLKKERVEHIKRFLKNLKDSQLMVVLRKQRFKDLEDLVYVLKQDRDAVVDGCVSSSSQKRDFRADNIPSSRHRPNGVHSWASLRMKPDGTPKDMFVSKMERKRSVPKWSRRQSKCGSASGPIRTQPTPTEQDIHNAVYRTMENAGWRPHQSGSHSGWQPPRPGWQPPRPSKSDRNEFCEKCMKFGHKEHNCWIDMVCKRYGKYGHPVYACRAPPCPYCDKCHQDKCEDFETMETVKYLARNGVLKGVPPDILNKLLDGKADLGESLN
ncbi:hypothetical protein PHMEG_00012095 [Phytophthora megakarya]|uniref:Retrotransposon gag domain-containing protein n=1 Tax=Phytophthora megakarya TaxID=4795 RepID=A0A225W9M0_9STRA|nr:hypothetical protein PHMEG_00012095 [Phytophthora megakarya]